MVLNGRQTVRVAAEIIGVTTQSAPAAGDASGGNLFRSRTRVLIEPHEEWLRLKEEVMSEQWSSDDIDIA